MKQIKVLIIAPYEGLSGLCQQVVAQRNDIQADICVASLKEAAQRVRACRPDEYDVILCRGLTGDMVQEAAAIPVVDIDVSYTDVIRVMQLASNTLQNYAFVGSEKLAQRFRQYCRLTHKTLSVYAISNSEQARERILALRNSGCEYIIGDGVAVDTAQELGMRSILVTSGIESVTAALENAIDLCHNLYNAHVRAELLIAALDNTDFQLLLCSQDGTIIYSNLPETRAYDALTRRLLRQIPQTLERGNRHITEHQDSIDYDVSAKRFQVRERRYCGFFLRQLTCSGSRGTRFMTFSDFDHNLFQENLSLYSTSSVLRCVVDELKQGADCVLPLMISGEYGSGKETLSYLAYAFGQYRDNPYVVIDCESLESRDWFHLVDNHNSPFFYNGYTICFHSLSSLDQELQNRLYDFIRTTSLHHRCKLISTIPCAPFSRLEDGSLSYKLYHLLSGICVQIPPLRDYVHELPVIAACYLNELNQTLPTQVIGFDNGALDELKAYSWPYNIDQLKQVLRDLVVTADSMYITRENVIRVLNKQQPAASSASTFDLNQPLAKIEQQIIRHILNEEQHNQARAAKRLGISRSTLWRRLQEDPDLAGG